MSSLLVGSFYLKYYSLQLFKLCFIFNFYISFNKFFFLLASLIQISLQNNLLKNIIKSDMNETELDKAFTLNLNRINETNFDKISLNLIEIIEKHNENLEQFFKNLFKFCITQEKYLEIYAQLVLQVFNEFDKNRVVDLMGQFFKSTYETFDERLKFFQNKYDNVIQIQFFKKRLTLNFQFIANCIRLEVLPDSYINWSIQELLRVYFKGYNMKLRKEFLDTNYFNQRNYEDYLETLMWFVNQFYTNESDKPLLFQGQEFLVINKDYKERWKELRMRNHQPHKRLSIYQTYQQNLFLQSEQYQPIRPLFKQNLVDLDKLSKEELGIQDVLRLFQYQLEDSNLSFRLKVLLEDFLGNYQATIAEENPYFS